MQEKIQLIWYWSQTQYYFVQDSKGNIVKFTVVGQQLAEKSNRKSAQIKITSNSFATRFTQQKDDQTERVILSSSCRIIKQGFLVQKKTKQKALNEDQVSEQFQQIQQRIKKQQNGSMYCQAKKQIQKFSGQFGQRPFVY